jgi:hypothetical protein
MTTLSGPDAVLSRVTSRLRWVRFGRRVSTLILSISAVLGVTILFVRLTGLVSLPLDGMVTATAGLFGIETIGVADWAGLGILTAILLLAAVAVSVLAAACWHDRPTRSEAARVIDRHHGTKDLFLTLTLLDGSAGNYQPLVARNAITKSTSIQPAAVVPLPFSRASRKPGIALSVVALLVLAVPQFDPFDEVARADEIKQQRTALEREARKTKLRAEQLSDEEDENSPQVKQAIDELKAALKKMATAAPDANRKLLNQQRKKLGDLHKMADAHKLKQTLNRTTNDQKFGQIDSPKVEKWSKELQEGSTDNLKKELESIKKDLEKLSKLDGDNSPEAQEKRSELAQRMQKKLRDIQSFASEKLDDKHPLTAALKRAKQQMKAMQSGDKELAESAQKHLSETMELAKQELQELSQTARDLQELEKAIETARMAQKANENGQADSEMLESAETLDDYREFYQQLMEQLGEQRSEGDGTGNRGFGKGGEVPEDDSVKTKFQSEISKSALTAGKVLLSLKTKGQSDSGDARQNYRKSVKAIKQGVGEAIDKEEIPKGYIEGIKKYFQSLDETAPANSPSKSSANSDDAPKK